MTTMVHFPPPLPPEDLRERVAGTRDPEWFDQSGRRTVAEWTRALHCADVDFSNAGTVLDFGCGCGRVARHLRGTLAPHQGLVCADVDAEAIGWVRHNIQDVRTVELPNYAPSPLADGEIDLIVSQSVFTHLPEDVQMGWLADLRRILRPGGVLLTSIHGPKVAREYYQSLVSLNHLDWAMHFIRRYYVNGFFYTQGRTEAESKLPEYYGAAFHQLRYIEEHWCVGMDLLGYFPVASLGHQDIIVMRKQGS